MECGRQRTQRPRYNRSDATTTAGAGRCAVRSCLCGEKAANTQKKPELSLQERPEANPALNHESGAGSWRFHPTAHTLGRRILYQVQNANTSQVEGASPCCAKHRGTGAAREQPAGLVEGSLVLHATSQAPGRGPITQPATAAPSLGDSHSLSYAHIHHSNLLPSL